MADEIAKLGAATVIPAPPKPETSVAVPAPPEFFGAREGVLTTKNIYDLGAEAARAQIECMDRQFAVPARQQTIQVGIVAVVVLVIVGVAAIKLNGKELAEVLTFGVGAVAFIGLAILGLKKVLAKLGIGNP